MEGVRAPLAAVEPNSNPQTLAQIGTNQGSWGSCWVQADLLRTSVQTEMRNGSG